MNKHLSAIFSSKQRAAGAQRSSGGTRAGAAEKLPFKRRLLVESLEQRVLLSADPLAVARVAGSIDAPGEVDRYTFHLDDTARVAVDSLTDNTNLRWQLSGPGGQIIGDTAFQAQSASNPGAQAPLTLGPGDYSISVNGYADTTGAYALRLMDLARADAMTPDQPVQGGFAETGESKAYTFDAQAGEQFYLRWASHPNDTYFRLYDPYGQQVGSTNYHDTELPRLAFGGRYTLLLDSGSGTPANASYDFTLHRMSAPAQALGAWGGGGTALTVAGALAGPGDTAVAHFSVTGTRSIVIDSRTHSDNFNFTLLDAEGNVVRDSYGSAVSTRGLANYADHGYYGTGLIELATGDYTLVVDGSGGTTGAYDLRLMDVAAGSVVGKGVDVTGVLDPGSATQVYRFDAAAGDRIDFDALSSQGNPSWKLLDPWGRRITWGWNFYDVNGISLDYAGRYTLVVSGSNDRGAAESFKFRLVDQGNVAPAPLPAGTALALGALAQGSIASGGGQQVWRFSLAQDTTVYLDSQSTTGGDLYWSLTGPRGAEVNAAWLTPYYWYGYGNERALRLVAGDYALSLSSNSAADFAFRLLDVAGAAAPLTLGQAVTGQLSPGAAAAVYGFDAAAGQRLYFGADSGNPYLHWRLLDPTGQTVVNNSNWNDWEGNVAKAGRYTLVVDGNSGIGDTVDYRFTLWQPATAQRSYDPAVSQGTAPQWGSDGAQPAVLFDGQHGVTVGASPALNLTGNVSLQARLRVDAFDTEWQSVVYKGSDGGNNSSQRTYTLWVNRNGSLLLTTADGWGDQGVQTAAGVVQAGQWADVTGVIDRDSGQMRLYVNGTELVTGSVRNYPWLPTSVSDTPLYVGSAREGWGSTGSQLRGAVSELRLWDRALSQVEVDAFLGGVPDAADTHLKLWLKMDEGSGATLHDASASGLSAQILSRFAGMAGVATGYLAQPGDQAVYHFTLPQGGRYYLDTLTPYSNVYGWAFNFSLSGPRTAVSDSLFAYYNRVLDLPAGDYTFTIDASGRAMGAYAFRLVDVATAAQDITADVPVPGQLNPGDSARFYRFHGNAGDAIFLQSLGASGFNPAWRLVDPFGREVFGREGLGNHELTLSYTGDYMLIVDGDYGQYDSRAAFSFVLHQVAAVAAQPIQLGSSADAGLQHGSGRDGAAAVLDDLQWAELTGSATQLSGDATVEAWVQLAQPSRAGSTPLFVKTDAGVNRQYGLWLNSNGSLYAQAVDQTGGSQSVQTAAGVLPNAAGGWHHVALVLDRSHNELRIVLDGQAVASTWLSGNAGLVRPGALYAGRTPEGYPDHEGFSLRMDQLSLWSGARSTSEIAADMGATLSGAEAGLSALWRFDEGSGGALVEAVTGAAAGQLVRLADVAPGLITGAIDSVGQRRSYTFTLDAARTLYLDSFSHRDDLSWRLQGPTIDVGNSLHYADSNASYNLLRLPAGHYTLTLDGQGAATGEYALRFLDAANAQPVALDARVDSHLAPGASARLFTFDAVAGQRVYLDALDVSGDNLAWRLLDPAGAPVFDITWMGDRELTLSRSGRYTLIVEDYGSASTRSSERDLSFVVHSIADTVQPLALGSVLAPPPQWSSTPAGSAAVQLDGTQQVVVPDAAGSFDFQGSFTIEAEVRLDRLGANWTPLLSRASDSGHQTFGLWISQDGRVDLDSNSNGNFWNVTSASGVIATGDWHRVSAVVDREHNRVALYVDGAEVASRGLTPGSYWDGQPPTSLPMAELRVGGTALDGGYPDLLGAVANVKLWSLARSADDVASAANEAAGLVLELPMNEGSGAVVHDAGTGAHDGRITGLGEALGATLVSGAITAPGQRAIYQLHPAQDTRVLVDTLLEQGDLRWSLLDADGQPLWNSTGQQLSGRSFYEGGYPWSSSDGFVTLRAGRDYQLVIDAPGANTGRFALRLVDVDGAALVTPVVGATIYALDPAVPAQHGQVTMDADGRYSYTPDDGYSGPDSFGYLRTDIDGSVHAVSISLTVRPDLAPEAAADALVLKLRSQEGDGLYAQADGNVLDNDTLGNGTRAAHHVVWGDTGSLNGTFQGNEDGSFHYEARQRGTEVVAYRVYDQDGDYSDGVLTLRSYAYAADDHVSVEENRNLGGNLLDNDDLGGLSLRAELVYAEPHQGGVWVGDDGSFSYDTPFEFTGTDSFTYRLVDADGNEVDRATVFIDVYAAPTGMAPVAVGESFVIPHDWNDWYSNTRFDDTLPGGGGNVIEVVDQATLGTVELNPDGSFRYIPQPGQVGQLRSDSFSYRWRNAANGDSNVATVSIEFVDYAAPRAWDDWYYPTQDGGEVTGNVLANDWHSEPGSGITAELVADAPEVVHHGVLVFNADGSFGYTPEAGYSGNDVYTYQLRNAEGTGFNSAKLTFWVQAAPAEAAPMSAMVVVADPGQDPSADGTILVDPGIAFSGRAPAAPDAPNGVVTTRLDPANGARLYAFDAVAGDQIVLDMLVATRQATWRLYDPLGRQVASNWTYYDSDTLQLAVSGRYTLGIEGYDWARGVAEQQFVLRKVGQVNVPALPAGTAVSFTGGVAAIEGTLTAANAPVVFSFTLAQATRLYVDTLTGNYPNYYKIWTLQGAGGVIDSRWIYDTDSSDHLGWLELPAGSYSFSVLGPYDWALGAFALRLVDMGSAAPLALGTPVNVDLAPANASKIYRFSGQAGQRLYIDGTSGEYSGAYWRLLHADNGAQVAANWFGGDIDGAVLNRDGEYLLYLEGYRDRTAATAPYSFAAYLASDTTQALALDSTVSASLAHPGDTQRYSFTLAQPASLWFDGLSYRDDIVWRVLDADGVAVTGDLRVADYPWTSQQLLQLGAGSYTLVIDGIGAAAGDFSFRLLTLASASATAVTPGTPVNGQLTPAGETDLYRFTAQAGQRFYFDLTARGGGGNAYWQLLDPYGQTVFGPDWLGSDRGTFTLAYGGTYTLAIKGWSGDSGTVTYGFNVVPVVEQAPVVLNIGVRPGPNLAAQGLQASGTDGAIHSGGTIALQWQTANTGDRDLTRSFQELVLVRNGDALVASLLVPYDAAAQGAIGVGASVQRSALLTLPPGALSAGTLSIQVITDYGNAVDEAGPNAEGDNASPVLQVASALVTYPDLSVGSVTVQPATGLAAGDQVSIGWRDLNGGDKAASGGWADRVVVRNRSTGEVVLDQTTRVAADQVLAAAGGALQRQLVFNWPAGRSGAGEFEVTITADAQGELAEFNGADGGELNNAATLSFVNAPDLRVSGLQVLNAAPVSGDLLQLQWSVSNQGNAPTPQGWWDRVVVVNTATNDTLVNAEVFFDPAQPLAVGGNAQRSFSVRLPEGTRSVGTLRITVMADQNAAGASSLPETDETNNAAQVQQAVAARPYADLALDGFTAPMAQRSGDAMHLQWTVLNRGNAATGATAWSDRVILSRDAVIGNGDDVVLGSVAHDGALAAGGTYSVELDVPVPGGYDGDYVLAVVTDAFAQVTEPDTRANNTSAAHAVLLTAYHADLVAAITAAPAAAEAGDTFNVSWRVTNQGDAATNNGGWYDDLWLSAADGTLGAGAVRLGYWWHSGALAVGASYDATQPVTLPGGTIGNRQLILRSDAYGYVYESRFDGNNNAAAAIVLSPAPTVDLAVQSLSVPALAQPGQPQSVQWTVRNSGDGATRHAWSDRLYISRDGTLANAIALGTVAQSGPLAPGASYDASLQFTMPALDDGAWTFLVVADVFNEVFESGAADAESNARAAAQATQLSHPDLVAEGLQLSAGATGGAAATLSWTLRNAGSGAAQGASVSRVYLSADDVLGGDVYLGEAAQAAGLGAGATAAQQLSFTLPLDAAGSYRFFVVSDAGGALQELAAGEANNVASVRTDVAPAPMANLRVSDIQAPAVGAAGKPLNVSWTVANTGDKAATGGWSEQVWLSDDAVIGGDQLLGTFYYGSNAIAAGGSATRTESVTLPAFTSGSSYRLVVRVDVANALPERNEADNAAIDDAVVTVNPALTLQLNRASVGEQEGASAVTGTVTRSGPTTSALTVLLASSLGGDLALPQSIVIPAGQSAASFSFGVIDNALVDGARDGAVTVAAAGFEGAQAALRVTDNDVPTLSLSAALTTVAEGYGPLALTLTRNTLDTSAALTVALGNTRPYKLGVPATVVIPAGQRSVTFNVTPVNDTTPEGDRTVDVSAGTAGFNSAGVRLQILDDDIPTLTLAIANPVVSEGAGASATQVTITRSIVSDSGLRVQLSGDVGRVRLPNYVVIEAGQASVTVDVAVIDNQLAEGDRSVMLGAMVADSFTGVGLPATRVEKSLVITDNDGATLSLSIDRNVLGEGGAAATATVTRNTATDADLTVYLSSSDTTEATVAQTVVIRAGQSSATFAVNPVSDGMQDGTQAVTLVAAAAGFNSGSVGLQVTDRELADLQLGAVDLSAPAATAGSSVRLSWTVVNQGLGASSGTWSDNVFLSSDAVLSADDQLVGTFAGATPLEAGASYTRSVTLGLGQRIGKLWAFVVTDGGKTVSELNEANNARAGVIEVTAPYVTTNVVAGVEQAPAGTPVQIEGDVVDAVSGALKPFALLSVKVSSGGTVRSIDAVSDKNGHFKATFKPLAGEAGHYTVAVVYPGVSDYTAQDSFDLLGMQASGGISASLIPGQSVTGTLTLKNLSPVALTGLAAAAGTLPPGVTLSFDIPANLPGSGTVQVGYTLSVGADVQALSGSSPITFTADGGVMATATLSLSVNPLRPQLVANPGYLQAGMLRGTQSTVSFQVTNTGGAATGALQLQLPAGNDWLTLASSPTLASLAPGESATVTLLLKPGADMALQLYQGSINVTGASTFATLPFQFRAVSEAVGDVHVVVQDEYTFFAEDKPNLAGATVELLDVYSGALVASAVTGADGTVDFRGVAEGPYTLQVSAAKHDSSRALVRVTPGGVDSQEIFLHRQAVTYNWTVVPTEIQDRYKIVLESTFETEVPMPVVTVDEPFIMPWIIPGYETQFNITLRNHGLINAEHVQIQVPNDPDYVITPLISELPVLAAKSEATIPCTIRLSESGLAKLAAAGGSISAAGPGSALIKCLGMGALYTYECRNGQWVQVPIRLAPTVGCLEGIKDAAKSIPEYLAEKGAGNLLTAGCDVISLALDCIEAATGVGLSDCETALLTSVCKAAAGAAVGGPVGALGGLASNWSDILACLCSLDFGSLGGGGSTGGGGGGGGGWYWGGGYGGPGSPYSVPVTYSVPQNCAPTAATAGSDLGSIDGTLQSQSNGVCAEVRLRIEQEAVITRTAFAGTLELNNGRSDTTLDDVYLTLDIRDASGKAANDKFLTRGPKLTGVTVNPDGTFTVKPSSTGKFEYTFVPTNDAAPDQPEVYTIGGTLHYKDGGTAVDVPLLAAKITVNPEAALKLDYFWQRDVIGDDPFTEGVEPSEPFALGLQVVNLGKGGAGNLTITSAQPRIVENEKGLLVDFKIIGSQVGANAATPSLTVALGNIAPGETKTAQWNLVSSLQGKFKDFSASFEHLDDDGDLRTSLIRSVSIHELTRSLLITSPTDDHIPDYLVNDVPDDGNLPDTLYFSTGGQAPVTVATGAHISGGTLARTLTAGMQPGWSYLQVADPLPGYELVSVVRSDGKVLPINGMVWRSNRTFHAGEPGATLENLVKLVDLDSTGSYTLTYAIVDHVPPALQALTGPGAGLQSGAVDSVDLSFSELIDEGTLTAADFTLLRNGSAVPVPALTLSYQGNNTWRVAGLGAATGADGNYQLVFNAQGITDLAGNAGSGSAAVAWAKGADAAVVVSVAAGAAVRNSALDSVDVTFSRDMDASSIDFADLVLTRDGQPVQLFSNVTVTPLNATTVRFSGLAAHTQADGAYVLTVKAAGTLDASGAAGTGQASAGWRMDAAAPTVAAVESIATDPRNTVLMSLDVTFSEPIAAASFDRSDLRLTRNGGPNLITDEVTVEQLDERTWRIKGFNWKSGLDGVYVLTVNASGLQDLAGNAGTGSIARSWTMDTVDPLAATSLVLGPDRGISATDGRTNTTALTLTGQLPEAELSVRLTDVTNGKELGYAQVQGNQFSADFNLSGPGAHRVRVRVVDAAGNVAPDSFVDVFVDTTAPGIAALGTPTPNPRSTPLALLEVQLDEAIDPAGFTFADLALTRDGEAVALDATVQLQNVSGNLWRITGLQDFTVAPGAYVLTVSATGLADLAGNAGQGSKSVAWTTLAALPTGLRGQVYEDLDGSGTFNPAHWNPEAGMAGRTVFLDANGNDSLDDGELSATTDADGKYAFENLAAGHYRVIQQLPNGWIVTSTVAAFEVDLAEGHVSSGLNFGDFRTGVLTGRVFDDLDADGTQDAGEQALAGRTVFLDRDADGELDAGEAVTATDDQGRFGFSGVGPGTVAVTQVVAAGRQRTTPVVPTAVKSGTVLDLALGDVQLGSISGMKFEDADGDGVRGMGERGIEGWTIFLDANGNGALDAGERSTLTDALGYYSFVNLLPGRYTVAELQREGWTQTSPLPGAAAAAVTTASSDVAMEIDCACGQSWATVTGPAMVDYGKLSIDTALATTGISQLQQQQPTLDGGGVTTVVIDTGIDLDHSFFGADLDGNGIADRIVYQWDFANNDADASDVNGHGSHIASLIGSQDTLYRGVATGTDLIALKVFEDSGRGYFSYLEKALQWVLAHHVEYHIGVVNLSLGDNGNWTSEASRYGIGDELAALAQTDVIVVAAAGNNYLQFGRMGVAYPASDPAAIAVGATWSADFGGPWTVSTGATNYSTGVDEIAAFSQRDTSLLDSFAPGARFNGANASGGIQTMQGTSQAAAFVSGAAALAQQLAHQTLGRGLSTGEFAQLLRSTGDLIMDGDDEVDNVANTGEKFPRLDMAKLAAAIATLGAQPSAGNGSAGGSTGGTTGGSTGSSTPAAQPAAEGVHTVDLAAGGAAAARDFGNFKLGAVAGTVFDDADADGALDASEAAHAGATVFLDADGNGRLDAGERSVVTGTDGTFRFDQLMPGTVQLRVVAPAGLVVTGAALRSIAVTSGLDAQAQDFGLHDAVHPPLAQDDTASTDEDRSVLVDVVANDDTALSDGVQLSFTQAAHGTVALHDGRLLYVPQADYFGPDSFGYTLTDAHGNTSSATVRVTVAPVNDAPVLATVGNRTVQEGGVLSIDLSALDADDDALTYTLLQKPDGAMLDESGHLRWTAGDQDAQFTVQVSDASGASSTQQFSVQVQLGRLVVTGFESKAWGFTVRFNDVVDPAQLNLYGSTPADVTVVGAVSKTVSGSVVYDADGKGFAFIRTGAQMASDTYTVTLRGASDGVTNARRGALDGDANGSAGGNFVRSFQIGAAPAVRLRLPDVARGPGQALNVPAGTANGVPLTLSNLDASLSRVDLRLRVDVRTFSVTEIRAESLPNVQITVTPVAGAAGQWDVSIVANAGSKLPTGTGVKLLSLVGSVPWSAALGDAGAIVVEQVRLNGNTAAPLAADAAVQVVAYLGDMNFDGRYTDADYKTVSALAAKTQNGLQALDDVDATILGDITGDGLLNSLDMAQILLRTKSASTATIAAVPTPPPGASLKVNLGGSFTNFTLGGSTGTSPSTTTPDATAGGNTLSTASLSITPSLLPSVASQGVPASA